MEGKKKNKNIPVRVVEIATILKEHGIDFYQFLNQYYAYRTRTKYKVSRKLSERIKKKTRPRYDHKKILRKAIFHFFRKREYAYTVRVDIGAKFRIVCLNDGINSKRLLEAFMNSFVEGDPALIEYMKYLPKYHEKRIFNSTDSHFDKRIKRMKHLFLFYNLPIEWWKKYTDLNTDMLI